jgi:hypothetical protein
MLGAGAGDPSRKYLASLRHETAHAVDVLVVHLYLLGAELADLFLEESLASAGTARSTILSVLPGLGIVAVLASAILARGSRIHLLSCIGHIFFSLFSPIRTGYRR